MIIATVDRFSNGTGPNYFDVIFVDSTKHINKGMRIDIFKTEHNSEPYTPPSGIPVLEVIDEQSFEIETYLIITPGCVIREHKTEKGDTSMKFCENCGEIDLEIREHKCDTEWEIYSDEDAYYDTSEESLQYLTKYKAFGLCEEVAIDRFCNKYFSDFDYPDHFFIIIRKKSESNWKHYQVDVCPRPEFDITEHPKPQQEEPHELD